MSILLKLLLAVAPLLLTVLLAGLTMEGVLNFGGGEKDLFLAVPLLVWSLAYLGGFVVQWWRHASIGRTMTVAAAWATGLLAVAWMGLYMVSVGQATTSLPATITRAT